MSCDASGAWFVGAVSQLNQNPTIPMKLVTFLADLRRATLDARKRLGDKNIAVRVKAGQFTVVRLRFKCGGKCIETPLAESLTMAGAVEFLDAMQPSPSEQCRA